MSRILNISFTQSAREPRLMRQVWLLEHDHEVTVIGYGDAPEANVEFIPFSGSGNPEPPPTGWKYTVKRFLKRIIGPFDPRPLAWPIKMLSGQFEKIYWSGPLVHRALELARGRRFDLVIAHDIRVLPVALRIAGDTPVLYDAHEYAPRQYEEDWYWRITSGRYYRYLCAKYLPRAAGMLTVGEGIANEYRDRFGIDSVVIRNAPYFQDLSPSRNSRDQIRMVHHGGANPGRRIETFIEAMAQLDERFHLDLILVDNSDYVDRLKQLAGSNPRIRFLDPVPMAEICSMLNGYDIGLFCIPPVSFNQRHCLPNKVFEFVQARLAVVSGPTPEVVKLIDQYGFGCVSKSFKTDDFVDAIESVTPESLAAYKQAAHEAAQDLCFENEALRLRAEVDRLLNADKP